MTLGLHHIAIIVSNEDSIRFYQTLGFQVKERHERPERNDVIVMMEWEGVTLELFIDASHPKRLTNPEAMGLRHLALKCEDVVVVHEGLKRAGYSPENIREDSFTGEKMFFVKDPDGQPIEIHEGE